MLSIADVIRLPPPPQPFGSHTEKQQMTILCCMLCGAYSNERNQAIMTRCDDNRQAAGRRNQKRRLGLGLYPATSKKYAKWRVDNVRAALPSQVLWLAKKPKPPAQPLSWNERPLFLAQYGLNELALQAWMAILAAAYQPLHDKKTTTSATG